MDVKYSVDLRGLGGGKLLSIVGWARDAGLNTSTNTQLLEIDTSLRPCSLAKSNATGEGLVSNDHIGADMIRLAAGDGFVPHTHPGDHLIIVVAGKGTITYDGKIHPTQAGDIYLIAGEVPHAVGAITDHVLLAVGSPHKPIDSQDRMTPVEYEAVTAEINELTCLICDVTAKSPRRLHEAGCVHCPCDTCNPVAAD